MTGAFLLAAMVIRMGDPPAPRQHHAVGTASQASTHVSDDGGHLEWRGAQGSIATSAPEASSASGVPARSVELCSETSGDGLPHGQCRGLYCPGGGDPWRWTTTDPASGLFVNLGIECRLTSPATAAPGASATPDLQREFATKLIRRPTLHLQPDPTATPAQVALVNGPVTAAVAPYDPAAAELHVTVPVPATIRATPTTTVDWGDGTTSHGTGTLTHTYRHRGAVTITAATTWQGAWWPDTEPAATTPLQAITLTATQPLEVHEAHSSLVAGQ
jgi:hypothetical protein